MRKSMLLWLLIMFFTPFVMADDGYPQAATFVQGGFCKTFSEKSSDYLTMEGRDVYGMVWRVKKCGSPKIEDIASLLARLNAKITKKSGTILHGYWQEKEKVYHFKIDIDDEEAMKIVEQRFVDVDSPISLTLPRDGSPRYFYVKIPTRSYVSASVRLDRNDTSISMELNGERIEGEYREKIDYARKISGQEGVNHLYGLPLVDGALRCSVRNDYTANDVKMTMALNVEGRLIPIDKGPRTGGIVLKNVPYGMAKAIPENGMEYMLKNLKPEATNGDLTPNGDIVFWLPAGFWRLQVSPFDDRQIDAGITRVAARMIPVYSGYLTEVKWPAAMNAIFETDDDVQLKILKQGTKAKGSYVDFTLLNFPQTSKPPRLDELSVVAGGIEGQPLEVRRLRTPLHIVVLLDSSGSMKRTMKKALDATSKFLKTLPKKSVVYLVDFDTRPKLVAKGRPSKVAQSLKKIRANGATALYDALDKGIDLLHGADRPAIVLFTDGKDANYNDTGPGSKTTEKEIFNRVKGIDIPIFTIGFGKKPDSVTLERLSSLTGGAFYSAEDSEALKKVFEKIEKNLGHQWRLTYKKPKRGMAGDRPVLALLVDNSGSMEGKMEKVRKILHDFIQTLPKNFSIQMMTFSDHVRIEQVLTDDRESVVRALSSMKPLSGTEIIASLRSAYKLLHDTPSKNRYLVYITDEAMAVDDDNKEALERILKSLGDDGVKTLIVGMVARKDAKVFEEAAAMANGQSVVSTDPSDWEKALTELSKKVGRAPVQKGHTLRVTWKSTDRYGRRSLHSDAIFVEETLPIDHSINVDPESLRWKKAERIKPYDGVLSRFITGDDIVGRQAQVIKRIPLHVTASNKAVKITIEEAVFLSKLKGVEPSNGRYLALRLKMKNILKPQKVVVYPDGSSHPAAWVGGGMEKNARVVKKIPDYLIPDARLHLFLSWNNQRFLPLSDASYLANLPLVLPSDDAIYITPRKTVEGTLIFEVPDEFMTQSALHLYDTAYGHIDLPISGVMKVRKERIVRLPKRVEGKLSDTFSLKADGMVDRDKVDEVEAESGNLFRQVDLTFISKVQAHLFIDPYRRFRLFVETPEGPFYFSMHPLTRRIPLGFYKPTILTPGSFNKLRVLFEIPKALADYPCALVVDLKGDDVVLPLKRSKSRKTHPPLAQGEGEGASVKVYGLYRYEDHIVADVAIEDVRDDVSTVIGDFLSLDATKAAKKRFAKRDIALKKGIERSKGLASFGHNVIKSVEGDVLPVKQGYLTELYGDTLVLNGHARRGFVFFDLPPQTKPRDFKLTSTIFKGLNLSLEDKLPPFPYEAWLTRHTEYTPDDSAKEALDEAIAKMTRIREAEGFVKPGSIEIAAVTLDGKVKGIPRKPPSLLVGGADRWKKIRTLSDLAKSVKRLRLYSSNARAWEVAYAPEAVWTQGWTTENELAVMAEKILAKQGIETHRKTVVLNDRGKAEARKVFANEKVDISELPAIAYRDEKGRRHLLVMPLFKEAEDWKGFIDRIEEGSQKDLTLSIEVEIVAKALASGQMEASREVTDALAGSDEENLKSLTLLSTKYTLAQLSTGPIALGFTQKQDLQKGLIIQAVCDSPKGREIGEEVLELKRYEPLQIKIYFHTPSDDYLLVRDMAKKEWPTESFFVMGLNVPDLTKETLRKADAIWRQKYEKSKNPDTLSRLKWLGSGIVARFVGAQSPYERELAKKLHTTILRVKTPRILVAGFRLDRESGMLDTTLDLVQPYPEIRADEKTAKRFDTMAGFYYTDLEAKAVPNGVNAMALLAALPKDTKLLPILPEQNSEVAEVLKRSGYPRFVYEHIAKSENFLLFPQKPLQISDKGFRTAWLEIEPESGKVWSYLDSGERGVVESQIGEALASTLDYMMGFWRGVQNAVWATAGFSLQLTDWKTIKRCAHGFARRLGNYLEAATQPQETLKPTMDKAQAAISHDVAGTIGLSDMDYGCMDAKKLAKLVQDHADSKAWGKDDFKEILDGSKSLEEIVQKGWGKAKEKYLGFANGYKDGVDWYFK